ncbi:FMN-binding protein [Clostridium lundense]|uniref:FMN-binding protein n=1 Tax=Clostridium lundense TaxID=319475 RepID=UPI0004856E7F|nr:FMN-binding protein [Clostridium lundense]
MKKIILSMVIVLTLGTALIGCGAEGAYKDGEYKAKGKSRNGEMNITVEVAKGKIKNIKVESDEKDNGILDGVKNVLIPKIIRKQSTEGVDGVTGATISSKAILKGVDEALAGAKK